MKRMKRLSAFLLAVAMCMLLSTAVGAVKADGVSFDATVSESLFCITEQTQTVTFGLKTTVEVAALGATVVVPEGWTVTGISSSLPAFGEDNYTTNPASEDEAIEILWVDDMVEDRMLNPDEYLISVSYQIPANEEKGEYFVGLTDLVLLNDIEKKLIEGTTDQYESSYNVPAVDETVTATVNVGEHDWEVNYTDTEGDTHTANYVCKNDASHTKSDEPVPHNFDNGDCVCGAKAPAQNDVTVVYKGAALANAYTVDGQVVTVEFDKACKVGYWDETAGKYIAIAADKISDNKYSFTAPEGVTEVLLVVKGDVTLDGKMNAGDKMALAKSLLPANNSLKTPLNDVQTFAADVNTMVGVNAGDKMTLAKALLPANNSLKTDLTW